MARIVRHFVSISVIVLMLIPGIFFRPGPVSSEPDQDHELFKKEIAGPRSFLTYRPKRGETLDDIRKKFDVSAETVIWSHNLRGRARFTGKEKLIIPPTSGIVYKARKGDTWRGLARKFKVKERVLKQWNTNGIARGRRIIIPGKHYPKHKLAASKTAQGLPSKNLKQIKGLRVWRNSSPFYGGWCTSWVYNMGGRHIPWRGDARLWPTNAKKVGWNRGKKPQVGAMYAEPWYSPWGHISLVVATNPNGSFIVSEMPTFGLGNPSYRIVPRVDKRAVFIYYPSKKK